MTRGQTRRGGYSTLVERLHAHASHLQTRMPRNLQVPRALIIGRRHPQTESPTFHERLSGEIEDVIQHRFEPVRFLWWEVMGLQMRGLAVDILDFLTAAVSAAEHFETFAHAVGGIADDAVEEAGSTERRVSQVRDEHIEVPADEIILPKIGEDVAAVLAAHGPAVDVGAHGAGAEMGAGDQETARADEWVVE